MAAIPKMQPSAPALRRPPKARNQLIDETYLTARVRRLESMGYGAPKWVQFCEFALLRGFTVSLHEAKHTASKYVTLKGEQGKLFKVRFSNHKPNVAREDEGDCDFFVGVANRTVTTTEDAKRATLAHYGLPQ